MGNLQQLLTEPTIYNVALTTKNTEYSQALPANCKSIRVGIQGGVSTDTFRIAFATGKVATPTAPYLTYPQNVEYFEDSLLLAKVVTIYIASSADTKVAQIACWA